MHRTPEGLHPRTGRRRFEFTSKRGFLVLVFLLTLAMLNLPANTLYGPGEALSTDGRGKSAGREPEISSMGAIARGDVPMPDAQQLLERASRGRPAARSTLGQQGNDRLVHSPTASDFQSETTIAKNGNAVVVGYNDIRGFSLTDPSVSGYAYSSDGGLTWTDGGQLPTVGNDAVFGDPDVKTWTDPVTSQVHFFYSSLYTNPLGQSSLCLHVSTDGGMTWTGPREVTTATSSTDFPDKEFMDVDPETGRVLISWTNFGAGTTMRVTYSDDLGLTWNGPTSFVNSGQGSVPRTDGSSGNAYIGWRRSSPTPGAGDIQFVRSTNNGTTWGSTATIATGLSDPMNPYGSDRISGFIAMDVDDTNGNVYVAYVSRNLPPDFSDVYFIRSTNGGVTWTSPVALNSNPGSDRSQFFVWLSVDQGNGRVDIIWYDQVNGTGTSDLTEVMHTHSSDGGLTWSCPTPLTDEPFHAEYGNTTSQPNIGDYIQCVSDNGKLYAAFARTDDPSYLTFAPDTYVDISDLSVADAPVSFFGVNFVDTGCNSGNGFLETGETVDLFVTVQNYSSCLGAISGISGTLTTTTPGVNITSGTQSFGALAGVGSTNANGSAFVFTLDPVFNCGDDIEFLLTMSTSAGSALLPFRMASGFPNETVLLSENFDGVAPPALPAGWITTAVTGISNRWETSTTFSSSGANSVFCADIGATSLNRLITPSIVVPANCDLVDVTFDITHNIELDSERKAWDGALLRVEIDDGATQTVLAGAFASQFDPFYPWQANRQSSSGQPIQDLSCWSSDVTPNFNNVHIQFPGLAGTTVRFFFDMGTDGFVGTATGMFVDNVVVKSVEKTCSCADVTTAIASPASVLFTNVQAFFTSCDTVGIVNQGPGILNIDGINGCTAVPFSIDTSMTAHTLAPGDTTRLVVCVKPTGQGPDSCTITLVSNAGNSPITIPVALDVVTAFEPTRLPKPFAITGVSPNPFNPSTTVRFSLPERLAVTAEVWTVGGARVRVLARNRPFAAGDAELRWDGRSDRGDPVASGVYFIRVKTALGRRVARAVLLK